MVWITLVTLLSLFYRAGWRRKCRDYSPEPCLMNHLNISWDDLTPFGINSSPRDILVWHTKTTVNIRSTNTYGYNVEVILQAL